MHIVVIGTGYVGLVTGTCFAEMGNQVTCVDIDQSKLAKLSEGYLPIYEPDLAPLVQENLQAGRLGFRHDLPAVMQTSQLYFIAVGTPPEEDGSADLSHVLAVAKQIGQHLTTYALIVNKSTVPVGTAEKYEISFKLS